MIQARRLNQRDHLRGGKRRRLIAQPENAQRGRRRRRIFKLFQAGCDLVVAGRDMQIPLIKHAGFLPVFGLIRHIRPLFVRFGNLCDALASMRVVRVFLQRLQIEIKRIFAGRRGKLLPKQIVVRPRQKFLNLAGRRKFHASRGDPAHFPVRLNPIPARLLFQNVIAFVLVNDAKNRIRAPRPGAQIQPLPGDCQRGSLRKSGLPNEQGNQAQKTP